MMPFIAEIVFWIGVGVQLVDSFVTPRRFAKGKLTRTMAKRVCRDMYSLSPGMYRLIVQWAPVYVVWLVVDITENSSPVARIVFGVFLIVVYGDDILTGGDDQWKRRLRALKNKINWQWLPQMEPVPRVDRVPI